MSGCPATILATYGTTSESPAFTKKPFAPHALEERVTRSLVDAAQVAT